MTDIGEVLSDLIEPTPEERIRGREVVLQALADSEDPVTVTALEDSWLSRHEVVRPGTHTPISLLRDPDGKLMAPRPTTLTSWSGRRSR